jgi:hypothetical protein
MRPLGVRVSQRPRVGNTQDAVEALLLVVNQNGPTMFARIGVELVPLV